MKRFVRDGDYWVIRDLAGNEHARFETNKGVTEMLVVNWNLALSEHGEVAAEWFLHGVCQAANHCTILSMAEGKGLAPYVSPPPQPPKEEEP